VWCTAFLKTRSHPHPIASHKGHVVLTSHPKSWPTPPIEFAFHSILAPARSAELQALKACVRFRYIIVAHSVVVRLVSFTDQPFIPCTMFGSSLVTSARFKSSEGFLGHNTSNTSEFVANYARHSPRWTVTRPNTHDIDLPSLVVRVIQNIPHF
jgi:hypothetical protein